jgi:hypothetical protein
MAGGEAKDGQKRHTRSVAERSMRCCPWNRSRSTPGDTDDG